MYVNPEYLKYAGVVVVSAAVAGTIGYRIAAVRYINYFDQQLEKETEDTIAIFQNRINSLERQNKELRTGEQPAILDVAPKGETGELAERANKAHIQYNAMHRTSPADVAEALKTLSKIGEDEEVVATVVIDPPKSVEAIKLNVFESDGVDEDPLDVEHRDPTVPYIITEEEFEENVHKHDQTQFTYYEGDDIVTNQRDEVVYDADENVGIENLTRFGAGNRNPNVVYVRNERLGLDFEINRIDGNYGEVVAGFVRHSQDRPRPRRFRGDDE